MSIDLDAAAIALSTSKEMLLRWARQGVIPAIEKDGRYIFERKAIEQWARRRRMPMRFEEESATAKREEKRRVIGDAMRRGGVYFGIRGGDVEQVLANAVSAIALPEAVDKDELLQRLLERESMASTGIGYGVAIPHSRQPVDTISTGGIISTCFLEEAVDYRAVDDEPVSVLFIILSSGTKRHLEILARLTFCLHDTSFVPNLKACGSEEDFLSLIQQMEENFQKQSL